MSSDMCGKSDSETSIEKMLKGIEQESLKDRDFIQLVTDAAHYLQRISKSIKHLEDSRNDFIKVLLTSQGLHPQDPTRWGRSETGKTIGRLDFMVSNPDTGEQTIIGSFNLDSLKPAIIDLHLQKLFYYDANGLKRNFILVYCDSKNVNGLWKKYVKYISKVKLRHKLISIEEQEVQNYTDIKKALAIYDSNGGQTEVHHLFINMNP